MDAVSETPNEKKKQQQRVTHDSTENNVTPSAKLAFFILCCYMLSVFIRPHEFVAEFNDIPLLPILLIASFLAWIPSTDKALAAPQFAHLAVLFAFTATTVATTGWFGGAIEAVTYLMPHYIVFLLVASTAINRRRQRLLMWLLVGSAVMMSIHGIQQHFYGVGWTGEVAHHSGRIRYIGIFNDPNDLGLFLVIALPMAAYLMHFSHRWIIKLLLLAGIAAILYGIKLTDSRGTTLALGCVLGVFSLRRFGMLKTGLVALGAAPLLFALTTRMDTLSAGEASAHGRVDAWYEGIHMVLQNPFFGVGFRNFTEYNYLTAHNSYILVLAELGVFGYFLWLSFIGSCILLVNQLQKLPNTVAPPEWELLVKERLKNDEPTLHYTEEIADSAKIDELNPDDRTIARVLFLSGIGFAVSAFFLSRSYVIVLFILCGMMVAHYQGVRKRTPSWPAYNFWGSLLPWIFVSAASVIFLYATVVVLLKLV